VPGITTILLLCAPLMHMPDTQGHIRKEETAKEAQEVRKYDSLWMSTKAGLVTRSKHIWHCFLHIVREQMQCLVKQGTRSAWPCLEGYATPRLKARESSHPEACQLEKSHLRLVNEENDLRPLLSSIKHFAYGLCSLMF
jgi:hypothetical protein